MKETTSIYLVCEDDRESLGYALDAVRSSSQGTGGDVEIERFLVAHSAHVVNPKFGEGFLEGPRAQQSLAGFNIELATDSNMDH